MTSLRSIQHKYLLPFVLLMTMLVASGCSLLDQSRKGTQTRTQSAAAQVADIQLRITQIDLAVVALDSLVMQPAPDTLSPTQKQSWVAQSEWLGEIRSDLIARRDVLEQALESAARGAAEGAALDLLSGGSGGAGGSVSNDDGTTASKPSEPGSADETESGTTSTARRSGSSSLEEIQSAAQSGGDDFDGLGGAGKNRQEAAMSIIRNIR